MDRALGGERDHLATYVAGSAATTPGWFHPVVGVMAGGAVASNDVENRPVAVMALVAVFAIGALIGTIVARSRVIPRIGGMPAPLRNIVAIFWLVAATYG